MHRFYTGGYSMVGMHSFLWIFWIVLIGVLIFFGWGQSNKQRPSSREAPHDVLQRRLADGQITPDEYEIRKALLHRDIGKP